MNKEFTAEYSALSKDHNEESVDDMLAKVDQFIEDVYRDFKYTPKVNTSSSSSTTSPVGGTSLSSIRGSDCSVVGKGTPVISEYSAQLSKDHNEESVDGIERFYRDFNYTPSVNLSSSSSTTSPVGVTSLSAIRGSGGGSVVGKVTPVISEYSAQLSKDQNEESVDDMLAKADQLIDGVYRDFKYIPTNNPSSSSSTFSPVGVTSLCGIRKSGGGVVGKGTPVISPVKRRKREAETARNKKICDNVDQNSRFIRNSSSGYSNSKNLLNIKWTSTPTSSTNIIIVNNITSSPAMTKYNLQINHRSGSATRQVVDLTDFQTPEVLRTPVCHNNDNVVCDIHPVVYLCHSQLNRQSLPHNDVGDSCCAGPSAARRRRTEPSPFTETVDSSFCDTDKTSNTGTSSSATADNTGATPFMCPVCMESCLQRQPTSTRCGHVFCKECIEQAIRVTHKCPMCNTKISQNQTFRIYL